MIPISEIMSTDVKFVGPDLPVYEALELLKLHKVSSLPVVNEEMSVIGMLSEKDVLRILFDEKPNVQSTVAQYMSREVICFTEVDDAVEICKLFIRKPIRKVPIVRDGQLVGIVSRSDIVAFIVEAKSKLSEMRFA